MQNFQLPPIDNDKQFEHLIADLLNEHYHTLSFKLFGKTGHQQKGIDIYSAQKQMVVQCKHKDLSRNAVMIKKETLESIEQTLLELINNPTDIPFATLLIATTASEHPDYDEYAAALRDSLKLPFDILFWGWETIQQRLSHLHHFQKCTTKNWMVRLKAFPYFWTTLQNWNSFFFSQEKNALKKR